MELLGHRSCSDLRVASNRLPSGSRKQEIPAKARDIASLIRATDLHSTSSGHGTIVDFTVFIAIASLTACATPSSVNG
ncbi:hypothetical protein ACVIWV_001920 [Bradyrhizobium diazoefficiens]